MKAKDFDKKFDEGEDITPLVNKNHAHRPNKDKKIAASPSAPRNDANFATSKDVQLKPFDATQRRRSNRAF